MPEADMYHSEIERDEFPVSARRTQGCPRQALHVSQGRPWRDTSKRRRTWSSWWIALVCLVYFVSPAAAVLLDFDNCLSKTILESDPLQLQFVPTNVSVVFNLTNSLHPLNVTVYGNVSGTVSRTANYPAMDSAEWTNPNWTDGKIVDLSSTNFKYTTLLTAFNVLSFSPFNLPSRFLDSVTQGTLPMGPVFNYNM